MNALLQRSTSMAAPVSAPPDDDDDMILRTSSVTPTLSRAATFARRADGEGYSKAFNSLMDMLGESEGK